MSLLNPGALWLSLLAVPLIALYTLRIRPPRATVATAMFWKPRREPRRQWALWYRVRDIVSLIFQLAFLALLVAALAEPRFYGEESIARQIVIVLDNSASMNATDVRPSRFEIARMKAERLVDSLAGEDEAAIVTAGGVPRIACRPTQLRSMLRRSLAEVSACESPEQLDDAIELATQLPHEGPRHLFVITDRACLDDDLAAFDQVHLIPVGDVADNVAITKFQARRSFNDPLGYEVLIEVQSFSRNAIECRLELTLNDKLVDAVPLELSPGELWNRVLSEFSAAGGRLAARLVYDDALACDNVAWSMLSERNPRRVYLVTPDNLFLEEVLNAQPRVDLHVSETVPESVEAGAIVVLHRQAVDTIPRGRVLVIEPVSSTPSWEIGPLVQSPFIAEQSETPLLQYVQLGDLAFRGARQLELNVPAEVLLRSPDDDPLLLVIHRSEGNVVVLNTDLDQGDLPLRTAFPILIANALTWLTGATGELQKSLKTGDFFAIAFSDSPTTVTLRSPSGRVRQQSVISRHPVIGPLDECGIWQVEIGAPSENAEPSLIRVACNLNDVGESNLLAGERYCPKSLADLGTARRPVWMFVVLGALFLTLAEWLLYHRRWIA